MKRALLRLLLPLLLVPLACAPFGLSQESGTTKEAEKAVTRSAPTTAATLPPPATATSTAAPEPVSTPLATNTATPLEMPLPAPPIPVEPDHARRLPTADEAETLARFEAAPPPDRDDLQLAQAYLGVDLSQISGPPPQSEPLPVGMTDTFQVIRISNNTVQTVQADLLHVSDHAYFWFENHPDRQTPNAAALARAGAAFDEIYDEDIFFFGPENRPGIDGDPRIYLMHVTLDTLCGGPPACVAGYFGSADTLPVEVDPASNERDIFYLNVDNFGTAFYLNVLAHELRHMIEDNYDANDWDWAVEGSASLAEALLGFTDTPEFRASLFLEAPDQQLNRWGESGNAPRYGQGYLLNHYLFDQLGVDLYRVFATSPRDGLAAIDALAEEYGLGRDGTAMWRDWLVALAIHDHPSAPAHYDFATADVPTAAQTALSNQPALYETTVHQYAADYYELRGAGQMNLNFSGSTLVPLLDTLPPSGQFMWVAQRYNYSQMRLTRAVDLSGVSTATLNYDVYHDIEYGYDYGYVSVSIDDGQTWTGLSGSHMQGQNPLDNPSGSAYTERFYTGRSDRWQREAIDLTPFAGRPIQLRFEYVTDPILTFGGLAIDNIAIPEINFYDDGESDVGGWQAEGFVRATAYMPQRWTLQLITFPNDQPMVTQHILEPGEIFSDFINLDDSARPPILIVAADSPQTLAVAHYQLQIGQ